MSEEVSLLEFLDSSQLNCLNENESHGLKGILSAKARNTTTTYLESDADEQLLLNISFNQAVRVKSIVLHTKAEHIDQAPKEVKLLINRPSLGFDDVEDAEEPEVSQVLDLPRETVLEGKRVVLRFVRFQSVNSLHVFVKTNQGGEDETRIDSIDVYGIPVETTKDLSGLRKTEDD